MHYWFFMRRRNWLTVVTYTQIPIVSIAKKFSIHTILKQPIPPIYFIFSKRQQLQQAKNVCIFLHKSSALGTGREWACSWAAMRSRSLRPWRVRRRPPSGCFSTHLIASSVCSDLRITAPDPGLKCDGVVPLRFLPPYTCRSSPTP